MYFNDDPDNSFSSKLNFTKLPITGKFSRDLILQELNSSETGYIIESISST